MPKHLLISLIVEKTTDKAILASNPESDTPDDPEWIPRSCIEDGDDVEAGTEPQELAVASWLLAKLEW